MRKLDYRVRKAFLILCLAVALLSPPVAGSAQETSPGAAAGAFLAAAMKAAKEGDWAQAKRFSDHANDRVVGQLITWMQLRDGVGTWEEYIAFLSQHGDWPGLALMRTRGEAQIPDFLPADELLAYFGGQKPKSGLGSLRLIAALERAGQNRQAEREILRAWTRLSLTSGEQSVFQTRHKDVIVGHHFERADMLLWRGLTQQAERMLPLLSEDQQKLVRARIALRRMKGGVDTLVKAVPESLQSDPGLAYERFLWRTKKGLRDTAEELLRERSTSAASLGRPERWANERRAMARQAMRDGDAQRAYELASRHFLTKGSNYADLEWLSGYIDLTMLNDAPGAARHFANFSRAVASPISRGRAGYWLGRALEQAGYEDEAMIAYRDGARYQTSFYGQLSAERAGVDVDATLVAPERTQVSDDAPFMQSTVFHAALLLHLADEQRLSRRFFVHLAETMSGDDIRQIADLALSLNRPYIALMIAKTAAKSGTILPEAYYPVTDLAGLETDVAAEIALSIARRESEFDASVVSPAGARGLMQLMPKTAARMSRELDLTYSASRLTEDWKYNAKLGSYYINKLLRDYDGSYILAFAAYNAGPTRVRRWIERYGDPRMADVDDVDWIEHIPFRETRNYVMRVMEAVFVYRARLKNLGGPVVVTRAEPL